MALTVNDRFWQRVDRGEPDTCWQYRGSGTMNGYGIFTVNRRNTTAHRAAWTITHGPIPGGMLVLHRCDNRRCCNPEHLFLGSARDNTQDMLMKRRHGAIVKPESIARGERNGSVRLTTNDVHAVRERLRQGESVKGIARLFGVWPNTIRCIRDGETWTWL